MRVCLTSSLTEHKRHKVERLGCGLNDSSDWNMEQEVLELNLGFLCNRDGDSKFLSTYKLISIPRIYVRAYTTNNELVLFLSHGPYDCERICLRHLHIYFHKRSRWTCWVNFLIPTVWFVMRTWLYVRSNL